MVRPDKFNFVVDRDATGAFVRCEIVMRSRQQVQRAKDLLEKVSEFVEPEVIIHPLAAWQYAETEDTPVMLPALKLVA